MHSENNKKFNNNIYISTPDNEIALNSEKCLEAYATTYMQGYESYISQFFFGSLQKIKFCLYCKKERYFLNNFFFLTFDLDEAIKKGLYNLNDYFIIQQNFCLETIDYCSLCKINTKQKQRYLIYTLPYNLIICFKGSRESFKNQNLNYPINLQIYSIQEKDQTFMLTGMIKHLIIDGNEFFSCIYLDWKKNKWFLSAGDKPKIIDSPYNHKIGEIIVLFYCRKMNS